MAHIADLGGLSGVFNLQELGYGTASLELSGVFDPNPINVATLSLTGSWVPITNNSIVPFSKQQGDLELKTQFNFVHITQSISTSQSNSDLLSILRNVDSAIIIDSKIKRVYDVEVQQDLTLGQDTPIGVINSLEVAQVVTAELNVGAETVLQLAQSIAFNVSILNRPQTDFEITQELSGYKQLSTGGVIPIPTDGGDVDQLECDTISRPALFTITEPLSTDSVTMKFPEIGDVIDINTIVIDKESRGHVDLSFVPDLRNQYIVRRMTFRGISTTLKNAYQDFLRDHAGLKMSITIPEGGTILGYVSNLDAVYTDESNNNYEPDCLDKGFWTFEMIFVKEVT